MCMYTSRRWYPYGMLHPRLFLLIYNCGGEVVNVAHIAPGAARLQVCALLSYIKLTVESAQCKHLWQHLNCNRNKEQCRFCGWSKKTEWHPKKRVPRDMFPLDASASVTPRVASFKNIVYISFPYLWTYRTDNRPLSLVPSWTPHSLGCALL